MAAGQRNGAVASEGVLHSAMRRRTHVVRRTSQVDVHRRPRRRRRRRITHSSH